MSCKNCDPNTLKFYVWKVDDIVPKIKCENCLKDYISKNGLKKIYNILRTKC